MKRLFSGHGNHPTRKHNEKMAKPERPKCQKRLRPQPPWHSNCLNGGQADGSLKL